MESFGRESKRERGSNLWRMARGLACGVLALSFVVLSAKTADADVVARGDLAAVGDFRFSDPGSLAGSYIHWDDASYSVFGQWTVNLGLEPGINDMVSVNGEVTLTLPAAPPFGFFWGDWPSASPGVLNLYGASGEYICPNSVDACGSERFLPPYPVLVDVFYESNVVPSGTFVDTGVGTLPTALDGVPITYALDGSEQCEEIEPGYWVCTGRVNLNAFKAVNTPPGGAPGDPNDSVTVPISTTFTHPDTGGTIPISLWVTYDQLTEGVYTNVVTSSQASGDIDPNFSVEIEGFPTIYMDITANPGDAVVFPVTICGNYFDADQDGVVDGTLAQECDLRVLHNDDGPPNLFLNSTLAANDERCPFPAEETTCGGNLCINTVTNQLCGGVDSLSNFLVAVEVGNEAPVCDANGPYMVECAGSLTQVTLDGSGSSDPDEDALSYDWSGSFDEGSATGVTPTVTFSGTGAFPVSLTVSDDSGASDTCGSAVTVVDTVEPVIDCNSPETIAPNDAPIYFTATAHDSCDGELTPMITGYDCYGTNPAGKRVDKTDSCVVEFSGDQVGIVDSGGLLVTIEWTVAVADSTGNVNETTCSLYTAHPVRTCSAARETSAPLWGLALLLLLVVRIRASAKARPNHVV